MTKIKYIRTLKSEGFSDSEILNFAKSENFELSKSDFERFSDISDIGTSENIDSSLELPENASNKEKLLFIYESLIDETLKDRNMINLSKLQKIQNLLNFHTENLSQF
jgi:hypothetical protein